MLWGGILCVFIGFLAIYQGFEITAILWIEKGYGIWAVGKGLLRVWYIWSMPLLVIMFGVVLINAGRKRTTLSGLIEEAMDEIKGEHDGNKNGK